MTAENPRAQWEQLTQQLAQAQISPVELTPDEQELYFRLATLNFFPGLAEVADTVAKKGEEYHTGSPEEFYGHTTRLGTAGQADYLRFATFRYKTPGSLTINEQQAGNFTDDFHVSNGILSIAFKLVTPNRAVFESPNDGTATLLDSPQAMFTPLRSHALYPVGSAADWINVMINRKIVDKARDDLAAVPDQR